MFRFRSGFTGTVFDGQALRDWLNARKPRNAPLRLLLAGLGLALLLVMLVLGALLGTLMLLGGLVVRLLRARGKPQVAGGQVLEGRYRVLGKAPLPRGR